MPTVDNDDNCPPEFSANIVYKENDVALVSGLIYKCKPFPASGWCSQPGYEPGTSVYWEDAWDKIGQCSGVSTTLPTPPPVVISTKAPTAGNISPTPIPTYAPTKPPTIPSPTSVPIHRPSSPPIENDTAANLEAALEASKDGFDNELFLYETPTSQWMPSTVYRYEGFLAGLRVMYQAGVAGKTFYIGDSSVNGHVYGLVNIAAFLAQSMKETIKYDACDENSWDLYNSRYPLSNSCGQLSQSYQDYHCSPEEQHMECEVDPNMQITAVTNAKWYGAPAPLKCGPKSVYPFTGYWDHSYHCDNPWKNPPELCDDYEGQKAGREDNSVPFGNRNGRTDVEGCCWWGRGVIQSTGVCNFGKLNYYLGKRAHDENRPSRYPTIDFCKDPEAICANEEFKELKWIAGMFYWVESLQTYDNGGWNYVSKLHDFVDGGMSDMSFIDAVSGVVNRGCHNPPCGTGPLDGGAERKKNFESALRVVGLL
jgi:predicted chitinase